MATVVCSGLTPIVYRVVLGLSNPEEGGDDGSDGEGETVKSSRRAKRPRARQAARRVAVSIPPLVRAVESLETRLLQLAEGASDATIMAQLRRSTARDIRVDVSRIADALSGKHR